MALTVGGWFAQTFFQTLFDKASDIAIQRFAERRGFAADMDKLRISLREIRFILKQSSGSNNIEWKELMQELKDAAYDAEDLIDEFQYHVLRQKIKGEEEDEASGSSSFSNIWSTLFGSSYSSEEDDMRARVGEIQERLDKIANSVKRIRKVLPPNDRGKQVQVKLKARETCSSPATDILFGREKELNQVVEWLLGSANQVEPACTFSVLPIVGIGGVGKTTLAQYALKDKRVQDHFDLKIWVCVSDNFTVQGLTKSIIKSVAPRKQYDNMELEPLRNILHQHIANQKFLLFLDDVWSDDKSIWENFCALLTVGARGSKVIVTTRDMKVSKMVSLAEPISLHGLDEDVFWQLFKECSFVTFNPEDYPGLEDIGQKIARKLKGSPLAAKTLGRALQSNLCQQHWTTIMKHDVWEVKQDEDSIMPALNLSYQYLDENIKQCFAFCSLFPKDHRFDKAELVRMWMAEGFINEDKNTKRMEDVGSNYFLEFVDRSFFQESEFGGFVMHDLIHDLAEMISAEEICRIENNRQTKSPSTTRHLRVKEEKLPLEFSGYNKLRTLVSGDSLPNSLFEKLRSIRVLDVSWCGLQELSEHIGKLIHLRYLDLSWNFKIKILPDSLCDLYHLQTLKTEGCYDLESIPQELGKLVNLRHFDISCDSKIKILPDSLCNLYNLQTLKVEGCSKLESIPQELGKLVNLRQIDANGMFWEMLKDVGRLTNLQELPTFSVQEDDAFKLGQLKDLTQLHGTLCIQNLEKVFDSKEAQRAELKSKVHLKKLVLKWDYWKLDGGKDVILVEEVIEGLQPHESLKILKIEGYLGGRPPSWLMLKVLSNLEKLELINCTGWDDLPFIGQRLHLIKLHMTYMPALKRLSHEFEGKCFPKLEVLELLNLPVLREWSWTEGKDLFPCIRKLRVRGCPKLNRLPPFPPTLEKLTIAGCPRLILNRKTEDDGEGGRHLPPSLKVLKLSDCGKYAKLLPDGLHNLTRLEINDCRYISSISLIQLVELQCLYISDCYELRRMECLGLLKSLKELKITECPKLVQLDDEEAGSLSSLRKLCVDNTALLKMFPLKNSLPFITELEIESCSEEVIFVEAISLTAVTSLTLRDCEKLQSLPAELLHSPPLLENLNMQYCPRIKSLPEKGLPPLLQQLYIMNCPQIKSLPEKGLPPLLQRLQIYGCPHIQAIPEKLLPMSLLYFDCLLDVHPTLMEQSEKFNADRKMRRVDL